MSDEEWLWVEYGFARFGRRKNVGDLKEGVGNKREGASGTKGGHNMEDSSETEGAADMEDMENVCDVVPILDEPLVMLTADHHLAMTTTHGLDHLYMHIEEAPGLCLEHCSVLHQGLWS